MANPQKIKGTAWERELVKNLEQLIPGSRWRRIPSSGAIGTIIGEPLLTADVSGELASFPRKFKGEAKVGYGGAKQLTLKKEWLDKIILEARATLSIPVLFGKFSGAQTGVKKFVVMDLETFSDLMILLDRAYEE